MNSGNYKIGFMLMPHAWRNGIATRACKFMTALAFDELGAHKLTTESYASNQGAMRVLDRNGYAHAGLQKGLLQRRIRRA
ncbi:GNAT family N-acetyltransferase [Phaeobacter sp. C3_T13_0]|uniref:GNAT family N-acetyltransferase n=1 Tax=Phaeobacter cretensis TaxID=3342641 RepID=UPI0039BD827D